MNVRSVFHLISYMVMFIAVAIGVSALVSLAHGEQATFQELLSATGLVLAIGVALWFGTRGRSLELTRKDGFAIVSLGWLVVGNVGALPYLTTQTIPHPVDAVFETISGFTTTGASVLTDIEALPRGVLFWRSLTQWLGGMGVLLLCVAILPFLGVGGMQIYRAEMPGPSKDRLTPRIANTAKLLYGVYVLITAMQVVALKAAGMNWFDAVNHSFCTISTGGFSTYNRSVAHFGSTSITLIITVFMLLGGVNFALHYRFLRRDVGAYFRSPECRVYLLLCLTASLLIAADLLAGGTYSALPTALVQAGFQVVSLVTTTGFATADFDAWPLFSVGLLFLLMFTGACAGSTSGGIKIMRCLVVFKECFRTIRLFMQPQAVLKVKMDRQSVSAPVVAGIMAFLMCFLLVFALCTLSMCYFLPDLRSAASASIACLGNVGPGLGAVGPTMNFSEIAPTGKMILTLAMLLGRLELFTVLLLFYPSFWKR